ncbi:hypothetical protein B0I35DRAFT_445660 [Stachybotrys elegans]|uniref:Methyltransferase domain-containing protein n=1 Tax=Stachybotrys elegans TaxID=80388 RepID=A0A8K0WK51_9HYPO|nr:hypothetical protein B0I35DRAFT_445660 [Stachybotrys elegans]
MAQSSNAETEAGYILPEPNNEVKRLTAQDEVISYSMNNKRILAPIDLSKPGLKILDSGTADGLFLRSMAPLLTEPYSLDGFDIMPAFFPPSLPPHMTLALHNLAEEWPAELHGQYDLVHQRLALLGVARSVLIQDTVGFLASLVRPGGFIQLGELDVSEPISAGQAMLDAWMVVRAVFRAVCGSDDFAQHLGDWLKKEGFEDVRQERHEIRLGPHCNDPVMGRKGVEVTVEAWQALLGAAQYFKADLPELVTDRLIERLRDELTNDGATYAMIYAYGRKPQDI